MAKLEPFLVLFSKEVSRIHVGISGNWKSPKDLTCRDYSNTPKMNRDKIPPQIHDKLYVTGGFTLWSCGGIILFLDNPTCFYVVSVGPTQTSQGVKWQAERPVFPGDWHQWPPLWSWDTPIRPPLGGKCTRNEDVFPIKNGDIPLLCSKKNDNTPLEHTPGNPPSQLWKESLYSLLVKV